MSEPEEKKWSDFFSRPIFTCLVWLRSGVATAAGLHPGQGRSVQPQACCSELGAVGASSARHYHGEGLWLRSWTTHTAGCRSRVLGELFTGQAITSLGQRPPLLSLQGQGHWVPVALVPLLQGLHSSPLLPASSVGQCKLLAAPGSGLSRRRGGEAGCLQRGGCTCTGHGGRNTRAPWRRWRPCPHPSTCRLVPRSGMSRPQRGGC